MESEIITAPSSSSIPEKRHSIAVHHRSEVENHDFETDSLGAKRIYKKTSPNSLVTLYLGTREIVSKIGTVGPLRGVLFVDPKYVVGHRLFSQLTLTFRYGREDEEVMGLKFCNEAVIALTQIWPRPEDVSADLSPLQEALIERLGVGAHAFSIEVGMEAPPSVQLIPAKQYAGAPIGTSYDIRAFIADQADEKIQRRSTVKLGIRLVHRISPEVRCLPSQTITSVSSLPKCLRLKLSPKAIKFSNKLCGGGKTSDSRFSPDCEQVLEGGGLEESSSAGGQAPVAAAPPQGCVDKPFLWTDGKVSLRAALNKTAYSHEEGVFITVDVHNNSRKIIRKIRVSAVQHVDVCMFSNGKFKNIVAEESISEPLGPDTRFNRTFELFPVRTPTKNWIAVEGALFNSSAAATSEAANSWNDQTRLAQSTPPELRTTEDRNVFAIYVSYYVKVQLTMGGMGGEVSLKLPFLLGHVTDAASEANEPEDYCLPGSASSRMLQKAPLLATDTQCEVISEMCEMSSSNNNLSTEAKRPINGENGPSIKDNGNGTLDSASPESEKVVEVSPLEGSAKKRNQIHGEEEDEEDDDEEEDDQNIHVRPVISLATVQVQVHASSSPHINLATELE